MQTAGLWRTLAFAVLVGVGLALSISPFVMGWFDLAGAGLFAAGSALLLVNDRIVGRWRFKSAPLLGAFALAGVFACFVATLGALDTLSPVNWALVQLSGMMSIGVIACFAAWLGVLALMDRRIRNGGRQMIEKTNG